MILNRRISAVRPLEPFSVELTFTDGTVGVAQLDRWIVGHTGVFELLNDPAFFRQVTVDPDAGTIVWPNGADLCPDVLYDAARPHALPRAVREDSAS